MLTEFFLVVDPFMGSGALSYTRYAAIKEDQICDERNQKSNPGD